MQIDIEGELYKEFSSFREALDYLQRYPYGTIEHPDMNEFSFLYIKNNGQFAFVDTIYPYNYALSQVVEFEDEILTDEVLNTFFDAKDWTQDQFFYRPGSEMAQRNNGIAWFDALRADFPVATIAGP